MWEIHYSVDGIRRWCKISADSKNSAVSELIDTYQDRYVDIIGVFRL